MCRALMRLHHTATSRGFNHRTARLYRQGIASGFLQTAPETRTLRIMADFIGKSPTVLTDISPAAWEHPADRAALQTLRSLPGFDQVVKKGVGFFGDRGIRLMFQANAVRVNERQFPTLHRIKNEVQKTLDYREEVPLYVSQAPWFNAGAYGVDRPFIVVNSATLDVLNSSELRVLLGHEMGHVMSGHALYHTMLTLLLAVGLRNVPALAGFALLPIRLALQEWSRKSELSADRAALLASQDLNDALSMFLKAAGGGMTTQSELSLEAYHEQVADYEDDAGIDSVFKFFNLLDQSHPFHTLRAAELKRWSQGITYRQILEGDYRKVREVSTPYASDFSEAAEYYAGEARQRISEVGDLARDVARQTTTYAKKAAVEATDAAKAAAKDAAKMAASRLESALSRKDDV